MPNEVTKPDVEGIKEQWRKISVGVLAFQGAFAEHKFCLLKAFNTAEEEFIGYKLEVCEVKRAEHLTALDALILPGGESTTMSIFLKRNNFRETLINWIKGDAERQPSVWGTCAGLILLANQVEDVKKGGQLTLGGIDITATRNSFGRQYESFEIPLDIKEPQRKGKHAQCALDEGPYRGIFIRAPGIKSVESKDVKILATIADSTPETVVAVQQNNLMATSFHPELIDDLRWHLYFLKQVKNKIQAKKCDFPNELLIR